jgi:hypothetical protein
MEHHRDIFLFYSLSATDRDGTSPFFETTDMYIKGVATSTEAKDQFDLENARHHKIRVKLLLKSAIILD